MRAEMERLAGEFHRAGITQPEFARKQGLHPLAVAGWLQRFPKSKITREPDPKIVAVTVRSTVSAPPAWLEIVLPSGLRLRFAADSEASVIRPVKGGPKVRRVAV